MVVAMSEVSERYERISDGFTAQLDTVRDDQWTSPTPCTDWTVRDLVAHVVRTHRQVVSSCEGTEPQEVDPGSDLAEQWAGARDAVLSAVSDDEKAQKMVSGMFGEQRFESLVGRLVCADTLIHTWDLSRATGQSDRLDEGAVAKCLEFLTPIDEAIRRPGGFAAKIAPPEGADEQTKLISFSGRAL
jgi:uncharacterized protein (TIGR03086 family)